jgi:hypothetical protein
MTGVARRKTEGKKIDENLEYQALRINPADNEDIEG